MVFVCDGLQALKNLIGLRFNALSIVSVKPDEPMDLPPLWLGQGYSPGVKTNGPFGGSFLLLFLMAF